MDAGDVDEVKLTGTDGTPKSRNCTLVSVYPSQLPAMVF